MPTHACVDTHTHAHTHSEKEGEPALAVIAEMINKRLRFNPEGFSASHTTEEGEKSRGGSEEATALSFQRETRDDLGGEAWGQMGVKWSDSRGEESDDWEKHREGVTGRGRAICSV